MQDATPLTFGQELSAYQSMLMHDLSFIEEIEPSLHELAIGATAVGTGVNAHSKLAEKKLQVNYPRCIKSLLQRRSINFIVCLRIRN